MNALRHGLLSREVIIGEGEGKEDQGEYSRLVSDLCKDLAPQGLIEEWLVQEIANCIWRLRRAQRCEVGLIRQGLDNCLLDTIEDLKFGERRYPQSLFDSSILNDSVADFERLECELGSDNYLSEDLIEVIRTRLPRYEHSIPSVFRYAHEEALKRQVADRPGSEHSPTLHLAEDPDLRELRKTAIEEVDIQLAFLRFLFHRCFEGDGLKYNARRLAQHLPSAMEMDRVLRYETAIK